MLRQDHWHGSHGSDTLVRQGKVAVVLVTASSCPHCGAHCTPNDLGRDSEFPFDNSWVTTAGDDSKNDEYTVLGIMH